MKYPGVTLKVGVALSEELATSTLEKRTLKEGRSL